MKAGIEIPHPQIATFFLDEYLVNLDL